MSTVQPQYTSCSILEPPSNCTSDAKFCAQLSNETMIDGVDANAHTVMLMHVTDITRMGACVLPAPAVMCSF